MRTQRMCARPEPGPAVPAEAANPVPAHGAVLVDPWVLEDMVEQARRRRESILARYEWIEARRCELWERMDRLEAETGSGAPADSRHQIRPTGIVLPTLPASPPPGPRASVLDPRGETLKPLAGIVSSQSLRADEDGASEPEPASPEAGRPG